MQTNVQKWGNSLGIRIPIHLAHQLNLHAGTPVSLHIEKDRLILQAPQYDLDTMLASVTKKNKHHLLLDDAQTGAEEW